MPLKNNQFDGRGGLWLSDKGHPSIAAQGSIQIGGRVIAVTIWYNNKPLPAPHYNVTLNEQKTLHDDVVWFKALHPGSHTNGAAPTMTGTPVPAHPAYVAPDDDIPF